MSAEAKRQASAISFTTAGFPRGLNRFRLPNRKHSTCTGEKPGCPAHAGRRGKRARLGAAEPQVLAGGASKFAERVRPDRAVGRVPGSHDFNRYTWNACGSVAGTD